LSNEEIFLNFLLDIFGESKIDIEIEKKAYSYLVNPSEMKKMIYNHLNKIWTKYLSKEWENNRAVLAESIKAYSYLDVENLDSIKVVQYFGCHSMDCNWESLSEKINRAKKIYLVPSVHLGPYKGKIYNLENDEMWIFFGNLKPENTRIVSNSALSKADLLIHFNALSDGIRLEILKLCASGNEYSSQELMTQLAISQSAVSRHLKQLSATGLLSERRVNSSKLYRINKDKIHTVVDSISGYLELASD